MLKIVKYGAIWCAPCRHMIKTFDKLKSEYPSITFEEIDVDDNSDQAKKHKIKSVPTIIFFDNNIEIDRIVGVVKIDIIRNKLSGIMTS